MTQPSRRPNVVVILGDQWRADSMGCAGNPQLRTPAIDRLAAEGAMIRDAYASDPVCTPGRAALITGRFPHANGAYHNGFPLPPEEIGFAEVLTQHGYACGYIGKWHLDGDTPPPGFVPPGPRRQGFDSFWAAFNGGHRYWDSTYFRDTPDSIKVPGVYEPVYQTELALEFLEARAEGARSGHTPFCLFLSWGPPHGPLNPPAECRAAYPPEEIELPPNVPEEHAARARAETSAYYGHVAALDAQLARLHARLDALGLAEDTIVVLTSDHGDLLGSHGYYRKGRPLDGGCRIPLLWRWPGRIPAGSTPPLLAGHVDFAPTLLGLCGLPVPEGVQGTDLSPWLTARAAGAPPDLVYMEGRLGAADPDRPEWRAARTPDHWLAVDVPPHAAEPAVRYVFDMRADPYQQRNLAGDPASRAIQAQLLARLRAAARAADDPHPALGGAGPPLVIERQEIRRRQRPSEGAADE